MPLREFGRPSGIQAVLRRTGDNVTRTDRPEIHLNDRKPS
jgi:hypothetical protein